MTRPATAADKSAITAILSTIELFPPELLDEQMTDYLGNPESEQRWLVHEAEGAVIGLLAIGVRADRQGHGVGSQLMAEVENSLRSGGARLLLVDTSGTDAFRLTRKFYSDLGYVRTATLADYWAEGDDKVIFVKRLAG